MTNLQSFFKSKTFLILVLIIAIAVFFRGYKAVERFDFAHDGDLYSWIVKDIVINKHIRLVGQVTSTEGIFIGPLFYYLLVPFYLRTSMEPTGGLILAGLISVLTVISFYFVFAKLFNKTAGLIAAFLQAVLLTRIEHDRWVVPTNTTSLWEIWYFFAVMMLAKGQLQFLPLLGFLTGLIWHINLSEAPILLVAIFALLLGKKLPSTATVLKTFMAFLIPSIPLMIFELRHGFTQTKTFHYSFLADQGGSSGWYKLQQVLSQVSSNETGLLFYPFRGEFPWNLITSIVLLALGFYLVKRKFLEGKYYILFLIWILAMVGFFTLSSKIISEYYFSNLDTIFIAILIIFLYFVLKKIKIGYIFIVFLFLTIFSRNMILLVNRDDRSHFGYIERKSVVRFLKEDAKKKNYPCIALNYITTPGNDSGFRYLLYLEGLHIGQAGGTSPIYSIVIPYNLSEKEVIKKYGSIGIIAPTKIADAETIKVSCSGANTNLTDPLFGYVE